MNDLEITFIHKEIETCQNKFNEWFQNKMNFINEKKKILENQKYEFEFQFEDLEKKLFNLEKNIKKIN